MAMALCPKRSPGILVNEEIPVSRADGKRSSKAELHLCEQHIEIVLMEEILHHLL